MVICRRQSGYGIGLHSGLWQLWYDVNEYACQVSGKCVERNVQVWTRYNFLMVGVTQVTMNCDLIRNLPYQVSRHGR